MFNKKIILLLACAFSFFFSCESDLDVDAQDNILDEDFLSNPENANKLVIGVYAKMLDWNMYSFSWIGLTSITSDDADKGSTTGDSGADKNKLDNLDFDSGMISVRDVWEGRYDGIYRANSAIFNLQNLPIDANLKSRLIGEAKFLRALFYFDLVRCFGGVPVVTQYINLNDTQTINNLVYNRKTKQETYQAIETDLLAAIESLPNKNPANLGRASKEAAQGLLAKVYLYQQKWQEAFNMSGLVTANPQFSLMPNYADVWKEIGENKQESLFEVQATLNSGLQDYCWVQGPRGTPDFGWGFNTPSLNLANSYQPNDTRKNATIMFVPSTLWDGFQAPASWNNPRYNYKVYQSRTQELWDGNGGQQAKNLRILKFSDVLLIRAEAGFQIGQTMEVEDIINNKIRQRAGLTPLTTITLQNIYNERRWEMAMEHDRWFDLVRTGQAQSAMAADGKSFIVGKHEVFPIPQNEIIKSDFKLAQNPSY